MTAAAPRRAESRETLLVAARQLFAEHGYDRTTMRAVAARAKVDPALIYHYFPGGKQALLAETLTLPEAIGEMMERLSSETDQIGRELVRQALQAWDGNELVREQGVALIRIAVASQTAGQMLRPALLAFVEGMIGNALRADHRDLRAALVLAHMQGILLHRYVLLLPPLATAMPEEIVRATGPVLQHYITGELGTMDDPAG